MPVTGKTKPESDIKVLHFGRFYNDKFGGLERHVSILLESIKEDVRVDNFVANEGFSNKVIRKEGYNIYKAACLGVLNSLPICPFMPLWLRSLNAEMEYDIIHLHFPDPMSHLAAYSLPRKTKVVISWHSDIIRQQHTLKLYRPFLNHIIKRADAIIAATPKHFSSSTQLDKAYSSKFHVIPYGIDFSPFQNPDAIAAALPIRQKYGNKKIIFSVGRHVYYKGYEYLIRAMKKVEDGILLLGGSGPLTSRLQEIAYEEGVGDKVVFIGRISDNELPFYYHASDIFCLPSIEPSEAFGIVQVEAMACKKPVICCELNNGVTYVNKSGITGLVVPPKDPDSLARAINELLGDDEKRTRMGIAGYHHATTEFSISQMREKIIKLYKHILDR